MNISKTTIWFVIFFVAVLVIMALSFTNGAVDNTHTDILNSPDPLDPENIIIELY